MASELFSSVRQAAAFFALIVFVLLLSSLASFGESLNAKIFSGARFRITKVGESSNRTLYIGERNQITWDASPTNVSKYPSESISLCKAFQFSASKCITLATSTPNDGSTTVAIPTTVKTGVWKLVMRPINTTSQVLSSPSTTTSVKLAVRKSASASKTATALKPSATPAPKVATSVLAKPLSVISSLLKRVTPTPTISPAELIEISIPTIAPSPTKKVTRTSIRPTVSPLTRRAASSNTPSPTPTSTAQLIYRGATPTPTSRPTPRSTPAPTPFVYTPSAAKPYSIALTPVSSSGYGWKVVDANSLHEAVFNFNSDHPGYLKLDLNESAKANFKLTGIPDDFVRANSVGVYLTYKKDEYDPNWRTENLGLPIFPDMKNDATAWKNASLVLEGKNERTSKKSISPSHWTQLIYASFESGGTMISSRVRTGSYNTIFTSPIMVKNIVVVIDYESSIIRTSNTYFWQKISDPISNPNNDTFITGNGKSDIYFDLTDTPSDFTTPTSIKTTLIRKHHPYNQQNYLNSSITSPSGLEIYGCGGEGGYKNGSDWGSLSLGCMHDRDVSSSYRTKDGWDKARLLVSVIGMVDISAAEVEVTYTPAGSSSPKTITLKPIGDGVITGEWSSSSNN